MEVKDITKEAIIISEEASFKDALAMMMSEKTNTLLVTGHDGGLVGEVSVTDLLDAIVPDYLDGDKIAANFASEDMFKSAVNDTVEKQVKFFMSTDYDTVHMHDTMMVIATTAIAHGRARIPVVNDENRPVGIISRQGLKHILASYLGLEDSA